MKKYKWISPHQNSPYFRWDSSMMHKRLFWSAMAVDIETIRFFIKIEA